MATVSARTVLFAADPLESQSVKEHLSNVYAKLGAANHSEAVRIAVERHIVG